MTRYILFSDEEIEDLKNGCEIKHHVSDIGPVRFMSREHFREKICDEEKEINQNEIHC